MSTSFILPKRKCFVQPQSFVNINRTNPFATSVVDYVIGSTAGSFLTASGTISTAVGPKGIAVKGNGTSSYLYRNSAPKIPIESGATLVAIVQGTCAADARLYSYGNSSNSNQIFTIASGAGTATKARLFLRDANGSNTNGDTTASVFDGNIHTVVVVTSGSTASIYVDGKLDFSTSWSVAPVASTFDRFAVGCLLRSTPASFNGAGLLLGLTLNRALTANEVGLLNENPWQVFSQPLRTPYLPTTPSSFKRYNKPRKKQPQNVSALNRANPLTRELAFLQVGSNPAIDFVSNHKAQLGSNNFPVVSTEGIGVSNNGSSIQATFPHNPIRTSDGVGTGDFTLFFYGAVPNVGTSSSPIAQTSAARGNQVYLIANSDATITPTSGSMAFLTYDATNNINGVAAAGVIDNNYHFWVGVRQGTTYTLYRDGVSVTSATGGISDTYSGGEQVTVGGMHSYNTFNCGYPIVLTGAYNRSLNANEVQELTKNPWQLYAPQSTSIFVPVTSGSQIVLPSSITSSEAFGTAIIIPGDVTITVNGIASAEAFGNATVSLVAGNQILDVSGIATSEAFGTAVVTTNLTLFPTGIASGEAFGNHTIVGGEVVLALTGIPSAEAFGTAEIIAGSSTIVPTGIPSGEAFGSALVSPGVVVVFPSGIASAEAFGTPVTLVGDLVIYPNGIPSGEAFGIPTIIGGTPVDTNVVFYVRGFSSFGGRRNA